MQHELEGLEQPDLGVDPNEHLDIAGREMHGGEEGLDSNQQEVGPLASSMYEHFFEQEHPVGQDPGLPESANIRIRTDPLSNQLPKNRPETAGAHLSPEGGLPSSHHLQRPRRKIGVRSLAG
ncbi:MAG: hypothetical protein CL489_06610 [Acidobacteria bacterium]|nr:hypothetical protein [Acidobacteriota bacterium]